MIERAREREHKRENTRMGEREKVCPREEVTDRARAKNIQATRLISNSSLDHFG